MSYTVTARRDFIIDQKHLVAIEKIIGNYSSIYTDSIDFDIVSSKFGEHIDISMSVTTTSTEYNAHQICNKLTDEIMKLISTE